MKAGVLKAIRIGLIVSVSGAIFGGCSALETVTDSLSSTVEGISDATSSTSGDEKAASFVENRFAAIRTEAARGGGENLDSLARLLGEADRAEFARFMKERYADLFTGLEQPRQLLARIDRHRDRPAGTPKDA